MYTPTTITTIATISQRINSPTKIPDMLPSLNFPALSRADRLEFAHLIRQRPLHRQALHRRCAVETVAVAGGLHDEIGILRIGNRTAMGQHQNVRVDAECRRSPGVDLGRAVLQLGRSLRTDRAAGRETQMADDDVRACDRHRGGFLL